MQILIRFFLSINHLINFSNKTYFINFNYSFYSQESFYVITIFQYLSIFQIKPILLTLIIPLSRNFFFQLINFINKNYKKKGVFEFRKSDFEQSFASFEKCLKIGIRIEKTLLKECKIYSLQTLNNLAFISLKLEKKNDTLQFCTEIESIISKISNENIANQLILFETLSILTQIYNKLQISEKLENYWDDLIVSCNNSSPESTEYALILVASSYFYKNLFLEQKSISNLKEALQIYINFYGPYYRENGVIYVLLGKIYFLNDKKESLSYFKKAQEIFELEQEEERENLAEVYLELAKCFSLEDGKENLKNAENLFKSAYDNCLKINEKTILQNEISLNFGKFQMEKLEKFEEAQENFNEGLNFTLNFIKDSEKILEFYELIALNYLKQKNYNLSLEFYYKCVNLIRKIEQDSITKEIFRYNNFIFFILSKKLKKFEEASKFVEKAFESAKINLPNENYLLSELIENIAINNLLQGNLLVSLENFKESLEIRMKLFGEEHFKCLQSFNNIAITFALLGNVKDSKEFVNKANDLSSQIDYSKKEFFIEIKSNFNKFFENLKNENVDDFIFWNENLE